MGELALSELQIEILQVLWARGQATTAEVVEALGERDLAHTTVATLLTRLQRRGAVASKKDGRQLVYRAKVSEAQVRRARVADMVTSLFGGDARALVAHLVREEEIAPGDLERIRAMLAEKSDER